MNSYTYKDKKECAYCKEETIHDCEINFNSISEPVVIKICNKCKKGKTERVIK